MTHRGRAVKHGYVTENEAFLGVDLEKLAATELCLGLGAATCIKTIEGFDLKAGAQTTQNGHKLDDSGWDRDTLQPSRALDVTITYATSPEPDSAGPMADMFLVPSGTIQITTINTVSVAGCTIWRREELAMAVMWHLAGFYFISAADVESRVLPQLDKLLKKEKCFDNPSMRTCCLMFDPDASDSDLEQPACSFPDPSVGKPDILVNTLEKYCTWEGTMASAPVSDDAKDDSTTTEKDKKLQLAAEKAAKAQAECEKTLEVAKCVPRMDNDGKCLTDPAAGSIISEGDRGQNGRCPKRYCDLCPNLKSDGNTKICQIHDKTSVTVDKATCPPEACKFFPNQRVLLTNAKTNWLATIERNHDLLRDVAAADEASKAGSDDAFDKLCDGRTCGMGSNEDSVFCGRACVVDLDVAQLYKGQETWTLKPDTEGNDEVQPWMGEKGYDVHSGTRWEHVCTEVGEEDACERASLDKFFDKEKEDCHPCNSEHDCTNVIKCQDKLTKEQNKIRAAAEIPCVWRASRTICPWTHLAPSVLIDNANKISVDGAGSTKFGGTISDKQRSEFEDYNVISFGGGGAAMDYASLVQAPFTPTETEFEVLVDGENDDDSYEGLWGAVLETNAMGAAIEGESMHGYTKEIVRASTTVTAMDDRSHASFHLEDPDGGDYFVVEVLRDPYYGTPLFYTSMGASSCPTEGGTDSRSKPSISARYVGPIPHNNVFDPDEALVFEVTLSNEMAYFEETLREVDRPGWKNRDLGYTPPTMSLRRSAYDSSGLRLTMDGQPFVDDIEFPKFLYGSTHVSIEVRRGPLEYDYAAPVLEFSEACTAPLMEPHPTFALDPFPTFDTQRIRFARGCGNIAWSGALVADQSFEIGAGGKLEFAVHNPGPSVWAADMQITFEYRLHDCVGARDKCWRPGQLVDSPDGRLHFTHANQGRIGGEWNAPSEQGTYDISARTDCAGVGDFSTASSSIITGIVGTPTEDRDVKQMRQEISTLTSMVESGQDELRSQRDTLERVEELLMQRSAQGFTPVQTPTPSEPAMVCNVKPDADATQVAEGLAWVCADGGVDCSAIKPGGSHFDPNTKTAHANYAFDRYYQKHNDDAACNFGGTAALVPQAVGR
jgi:hypothetical protein